MKHSLVKIRDVEIMKMYKNGHKKARIGAFFKITRQRVAQILKGTLRTKLTYPHKKLALSLEID